MTQDLSKNPPFLAFLSDEASLIAAREVAKAEGFAADAVQQGTILDAIALLKNHPSPRIVLVEIPNAKDAPKLMDDLADICDPGVKVIVTSKVNEFSFYAWLMEMGVHAYLLEPFGADQLRQALKTPEAKAKADATPEKPGNVISFLGVRGGVGTTTLATNLGYLFGKTYGRETVYVDLDVHFGSGAMAFDLEPSRGLLTMFETPERIDGLFLDRVTMKLSDKLSILAGEEQMKDPAIAKAAASEMLISRMKEKYKFMLIDLPRSLTPMTRTALNIADTVVLVAEPTLLSLRDALRIGDYLREVMHKTPLLVVNKMGLAGRQELKKAEFEKHYGKPADLYLPAMNEAHAATSNGEMLIDVAGKHAGVSGLQAFAKRLIGEEVTDAVTPKKSLWKKGK